MKPQITKLSNISDTQPNTSAVLPDQHNTDLHTAELPGVNSSANISHGHGRALAVSEPDLKGPDAVNNPPPKMSVPLKHHIGTGLPSKHSVAHSVSQPLLKGADTAQGTAQFVAEQLKLEATKEGEADILDGDVAMLRANITALTKVAVEYGNEAGKQAAERRGDEIMRDVSNLTHAAEEAEIEAATLRSRSLTELQTANDYMLAAEKALDDSSRRSAP